MIRVARWTWTLDLTLTEKIWGCNIRWTPSLVETKSKKLGIVPKSKRNHFHPLRSFCLRKKPLHFLFFVQLFLFLLVGFGWFAFFYAQNLFIKRKKNSLEIVLVTSFTILLTCTPIKPPFKGLFVRTYFYLWLSRRISSFYEKFLNLFLFMIICVNLFFKSLWKYASAWILPSKTNLLTSNHDNHILLISYVPSLCFFATNSSHLVLSTFLLNKVSLKPQSQYLLLLLH